MHYRCNMFVCILLLFPCMTCEWQPLRPIRGHHSSLTCILLGRFHFAYCVHAIVEWMLDDAPARQLLLTARSRRPLLNRKGMQQNRGIASKKYQISANATYSFHRRRTFISACKVHTICPWANCLCRWHTNPMSQFNPQSNAPNRINDSLAARWKLTFNFQLECVPMVLFCDSEQGPGTNNWQTKILRWSMKTILWQFRFLYAYFSTFCTQWKLIGSAPWRRTNTHEPSESINPLHAMRT